MSLPWRGDETSPGCNGGEEEVRPACQQIQIQTRHARCNFRPVVMCLGLAAG